ncbi:MAG TPA: hypothetical protein VMD74_01875 [Candidatus Methylomirabilis sp.]|nr:hypothetical protein [Candidatus Methylomirabilis sp.]
MPEEELKKNAPQPVEERDKHRALLAGVLFFMILIVLLWLVNINNSFRSLPVFTGQKDDFEARKIYQDLNASLNQVEAKIEGLREIAPDDLQKFQSNYPPAGISSSSPAVNAKNK